MTTISDPLALVEPEDPATLDMVRELFREYQRSLDVDLCFQSFDAELAGLPGAYARPNGRLYVGLSGGDAAGCVALRRRDGGDAEMKRLFVRPAFRGQGHGWVLARRIIDDARALGYSRLVLDTLPSMRPAQAMYEALGFRDTAPYTFNPVVGTRFMALDLRSGRPSPDAGPGPATLGTLR